MKVGELLVGEPLRFILEGAEALDRASAHIKEDAEAYKDGNYDRD